MDVSILIPLLNEEESLPELFRWIKKVAEDHNFTFEVVFVDDGSTDGSWRIIQSIHNQHPGLVKAIRFQRNYGKSAALNTGFGVVEGDIVVTMDADLQDSPEEIPGLMHMIKEEDYDLVSGWKRKRYDPISKTLPTKLYNWTTRRMSGIKLHDFNCGLKAYRKEVVKNIEVFGEMHRYIPVIANRQGFRRIGEKVVQHRARKYGKSKFGMERFINGFLDLLTISFIGKFGKKPMHLFGLLGTLMFMIGAGMFMWIGGQKLYFLYKEMPAKNITEISTFYIALVAMMMGTQLFLAGFLGELISRNSPQRNNYRVSETLS